jgi:tRNA (guanine10-N2)-dimethyltransferase
VAGLFFLLSGEHETLPASEVQAILEAEGYNYRVLERLTQVLRLEADANSVKAIKFRSALTRICCREIFNCGSQLYEILDSICSASLEEFMEGGGSFVVRVKRVKSAAPQLSRVELERKLGEQILEKVTKSRVNLTNPQKTFFGVLTDNRFVLGLKIAEVPTKPFSERSPKKRPVFHPTAMHAKLARAMVNLAQPRTGDLILDPFCGTGGILVEAGLIGGCVVGFDAKPHMLRGGLQNLLHFGIEPEGVVVADARHPPLSKVDCVVTDPPYGRSASTLGMSTRKIVEDFLSAVVDVVPRGNRVCMASPKPITLDDVGEEAGFRHVESHFIYVHRSLTREIAVFKRP